MSAGPRSGSYEFGRSTLGPVLLSYVAALDNLIRHFSCDKNAKVLFCARAGVRILKLYQAYLDATGRPMPPNVEPFWISRFMCAKGIWNKNFQISTELLEREFRHAPLRDLVAAIYRTTELPQAIDLSDPALDETGAQLSSFIWGPSLAADYVRWHLAEQSECFELYTDALIGSHDSVLLIDSGWQGTVQTALTDWRPEIDWWGGYFGRSGVPGSDRRYWDKMIGLAFEADVFDKDRPETAITLHRHLIEGLFEPSGVSIEHLANTGKGIIAPGAAALLADAPDAGSAPLFTGVIDHIRSAAKGASLARIVEAARLASQRLARTIVFPTEQEARILGDMQRSADFGRSLLVPLLNEPVARHDADNSESRIQDSLWPAAQAALEYPPEVAIPRQQQISGHKIAPRHFAGPCGAVAQAVSQSTPHRPAVAVITRTMDRPIFLRRALASVADQDFDDYIHVVVCDGGDIEEVRAVIDRSGADKRRIMLVDNVVNRGMEAASNIAIRHSDSEFVIIHDDDDTWQPQFLSHMVAYLRGAAGRKYGGAISHTWYVSEEVTRDGIEIRSRKPYHDWVNNIQLMEMAQENFFAPIAFLFRRSVYDEIGGFDERFPVLGDWDFNLRFLAAYDIGVLPEKLANYHHRDVGNTAMFANSVVGAISKHAEFNAIMRNKYIRANETNADGRIGAIVALGAAMNDMRYTARRTLSETERLGASSADRGSSSLAALQRQADERWLTIEMLAQQNRELIDEIAAAKARLAQFEDLEASIGEDIRSAQTDWRKLADERWLALAVIAQSMRKTSAFDPPRAVEAGKPTVLRRSASMRR